MARTARDSSAAALPTPFTPAERHLLESDLGNRRLDGGLGCGLDPTAIEDSLCTWPELLKQGAGWEV
eukprot:scaffold100470_cov31-Tisochrysis_lutea.AAC.2